MGREHFVVYTYKENRFLWQYKKTKGADHVTYRPSSRILEGFGMAREVVVYDFSFGFEAG